MERLTKRRNGVCTYIGPRCMYPDTGETAAEMDFINARTVLERLAAYEDTGLEPEEVRVLAVAEEKRKASLADMQVEKTLDGVQVGVVLPKLDMESSELKEMPEYIEREATLKVITAKAEVYDVGQGDALEGLYVADREVAQLPAADVVSAEEFALLEAKNEVLGQENDRLKAEIKRLHEENFWLTGGLGHEEG